MIDLDAPSMPDLDREYSPSSVAPDFLDIVAAYRTRSDAVRTKLDFRYLSYGERADEIVALSGPIGGGRPVHLFIHGGYWQDLSWEDSLAPAVDFARAGFLYGAINYTLAPAISVAGIVAQCEAAVAAVAKASLAAGGPGRVSLSGSSAGGHLAAMLAVADWSRWGLERSPVARAVLLSGVFDLRPLIRTYINGPLALDEASAALASPMLLPRIPDCPMLVLWGEHETTAFKRQSLAYAERIVEAGGRARAQEISGRNHFDIVFDLAAPGTQLGGMVVPFLGEKE